MNPKFDISPSDTPLWLRSPALVIALCISLSACPEDDVQGEPASDISVEDGMAMDAATDGSAADGTAADAPEPAPGCETIASAFQTLGSANANLPEPSVSAVCAGDSVVVSANAIPDFPYIETSPGLPRETDAEYTFPANPTPAATTTAVPLLGPLGVAVNGIPIFGPTEGGGGDVMALGDGFSECGGHNGPSGYHYHTFDVTGSDDCRFSEAQAAAGHILFGYAFDGYPIYSGNVQFTSSYQLTDASLFADDTWAAHTYVEGSGDLDACNGRTDADGNYAYYTTETFPYVLGCYRGTPTANEPVGGPPGGGPPGQ